MCAFAKLIVNRLLSAILTASRRPVVSDAQHECPTSNLRGESAAGRGLPTRDVRYHGEYRGHSGPAADIGIPGGIRKLVNENAAHHYSKCMNVIAAVLLKQASHTQLRLDVGQFEPRTLHPRASSVRIVPAVVVNTALCRLYAVSRALQID